MKIEEFMKAHKHDFVDCGYTVYNDRWPQCWFKLYPQQIEKYKRLDKKTILFKCEHQANIENFPNAGIIDTTRIQLNPSTSVLSIEGSFAVTEKFINYFLNA